MYKVKFLVINLVLLVAFSWLPSIVFADLSVGIFPRRPAAASAKAFQPLAEHLSQVLGEKVNLVIPKNFQEFWEGMEQQKYDIVHLNQYHYIKGHKEFGYQVIVANQEFGTGQISGALAVRKDSGINTVADLKGKTILFGGSKKAMGSYIATTAVLKQAGLEADKDYKVQFAKNPPSALLGVYNKVADASGSGDVILKIKSVTKKVDVEQMKILAVSEPFTHLSWAVKGDIPQDKVLQIQKAMISLADDNAGKEILNAAKVEKFYAVTDADFNKVRQITKFAIGEEY
ncbi:MAG: PhnD/SsuA/transferrin family substrate-binding protein [Gammaproteobacteria bacterium]|jgi:phosphonate transport system substrate-binding protein